jgi:hypothetical protein
VRGNEERSGHGSIIADTVKRHEEKAPRKTQDGSPPARVRPKCGARESRTTMVCFAGTATLWPVNMRGPDGPIRRSEMPNSTGSLVSARAAGHPSPLTATVATEPAD